MDSRSNHHWGNSSSSSSSLMEDWGNCSSASLMDHVEAQTKRESIQTDWLGLRETFAKSRAQSVARIEQEKEEREKEQVEQTRLEEEQAKATEQAEWEALDDGTDIPPWHRSTAPSKPTWLLELLVKVAEKEDADDFYKQYKLPQNLPAKQEIEGIKEAAQLEQQNTNKIFKTPLALPPKQEAQAVRQAIEEEEIIIEELLVEEEDILIFEEEIVEEEMVEEWEEEEEVLDHPPEYIPAASWQGSKPGYCFGTPIGKATGYYLDPYQRMEDPTPEFIPAASWQGSIPGYYFGTPIGKATGYYLDLYQLEQNPTMFEQQQQQQFDEVSVEEDIIYSDDEEEDWEEEEVMDSNIVTEEEDAVSNKQQATIIYDWSSHANSSVSDNLEGESKLEFPAKPSELPVLTATQAAKEKDDTKPKSLRNDNLHREKQQDTSKRTVDKTPAQSNEENLLGNVNLKPKKLLSEKVYEDKVDVFKEEIKATKARKTARSRASVGEDPLASKPAFALARAQLKSSKPQAKQEKNAKLEKPPLYQLKKTKLENKQRPEKPAISSPKVHLKKTKPENKPKLETEDQLQASKVQYLKNKKVLRTPSFTVSREELEHNVVQDKLHNKPRLKKPAVSVTKDQLKTSKVQYKLKNRPVLRSPSLKLSTEELEHNVVQDKLHNKPKRMHPSFTVSKKELEHNAVQAKLHNKPKIKHPSFTISKKELKYNMVQDKLHNKPKLKHPALSVTMDQLKTSKVQYKLDHKPTLRKPSFTVSKNELKHNVVQDKLHNKPNINHLKTHAADVKNEELASIKYKLKPTAPAAVYGWKGPSATVVSAESLESQVTKPLWMQRTLVLQNSARELTATTSADDDIAKKQEKQNVENKDVTRPGMAPWNNRQLRSTVSASNLKASKVTEELEKKGELRTNPAQEKLANKPDVSAAATTQDKLSTKKKSRQLSARDLAGPSALVSSANLTDSLREEKPAWMMRTLELQQSFRGLDSDSDGKDDNSMNGSISEEKPEWMKRTRALQQSFREMDIEDDGKEDCSSNGPVSEEKPEWMKRAQALQQSFRESDTEDDGREDNKSGEAPWRNHKLKPTIQ